MKRERSVEELSMSDEDSPPIKKVYKAPTADKEEKPMDVFKSLYSDLKECIPNKEVKDGNVKKEKPNLMQKARGFFGL